MHSFPPTNANDATVIESVGAIGFGRVFHYHDHYQKKTTKSHHSHIILSHLYLRKNLRQISRFRFRNDNDKYSDHPSCVFLLQISKNPNLFVSKSCIRKHKRSLPSLSCYRHSRHKPHPPIIATS